MTGKAAILIIDVLNSFDFEGGDDLAEAARAIIDPINRLRHEAAEADVPVIFVNDHDGRWRDERSALIAHFLSGKGHDLAAALRPGDDDYFVIKPESSGFYATTLPALLPRLGVTRLVITGLAADICVLFTAADAHMREYDLWVPSDAVAAQTPERAHWAGELIGAGMSAELRPTEALPLTDWLAMEPKVAAGRG